MSINIKQLEKNILENYNNLLSNKKIEDEDISKLLKSLLMFRYLDEYFDTDQTAVIKALSTQDFSGKLVFPCDIIELRQILFQRKIFLAPNVVLFSPVFASKFLNRYPILIKLKKSKLEEGYNLCGLGGVYYFDKPSISLEEGSISGISLMEPMDQESKLIIGSIIDDCDIDFDINLENALPGVSSYNPKLTSQKIAQDVTKNYIKHQVEGTPMEKPIGNPLDLQVGTKVRWRNRGMLLKQYYGEVVRINNQFVFVNWKTDGKEVMTKFPFGNPALIWKYLARVED